MNASAPIAGRAGLRPLSRLARALQGLLYPCIALVFLEVVAGFDRHYQGKGWLQILGETATDLPRLLVLAAIVLAISHAIRRVAADDS